MYKRIKGTVLTAQPAERFGYYGVFEYELVKADGDIHEKLPVWEFEELAQSFDVEESNGVVYAYEMAKMFYEKLKEFLKEFKGWGIERVSYSAPGFVVTYEVEE